MIFQSGMGMSVPEQFPSPLPHRKLAIPGQLHDPLGRLDLPDAAGEDYGRKGNAPPAGPSTPG